jgi:hypothetical protein
MAGTKKSGRPGGNPEMKADGALSKYYYQPKGDKPLSKILSCRIPEDLHNKIKSGENWQEAFRQKLEELYGDR